MIGAGGQTGAAKREQTTIAASSTPGRGQGRLPAPPSRGSPSRRGTARPRAALLVVAAAALIFAGCSPGGGRDGGAILVAAAASLTDALTEVGRAYEEETGARVQFTFGGSSALARQVELGAPVDAVVFAGAGPMDRLEGKGLLAAGTRADVLTNRLVVIGRRGAHPIATLADLRDAGGRIAIADPSLAPAGGYAKQALAAAGLWDGLEGRVVMTLDVRAAAGAVATGNAAFGIVYATDAAATAGADVLLVVPPGLHPLIEYPGAAVARSGGAGPAARFIEYLRGQTARDVFERHGFSPAGR